MQLSPRFHQPSMPSRQETGDQFDRVKTENPHVVLVVRMKMWHMMRRSQFGKHANYNSEKPADFRQRIL